MVAGRRPRRPGALAAALVAVLGCGGGPREPGGVVRVEVPYAGAGAATVEAEVLGPLEPALAGVARVTGIRAIAGPDGATIDVRFARGVERETAATAVRAALAPALASLPAEAGVPTITVGRPTSWVYATAPAMDATRARYAAESIAGVVRVEVCGDFRPTVAIDLDPARLAAQALTAPEVLAALEAMSSSVPGGRLDTTGMVVTVRAGGVPSSIDELAEVRVGGRGVPLRDVATVRAGADSGCTVVGRAGATLLRAGLRGTDDERVQTRRAVEQRWRAMGATVLARPITVGLVDTPSPITGDDAELRAWLQAVAGGLALTSATAGHVVLLWAGHDPASLATAREVLSAPEVIMLGPTRWAITAAPLIEATVRGDDAVALAAQARAAVTALGDEPAVAAAGCRPCRLGTTARAVVDRDRMAVLGVSAAAVAAALRWARPQPAATMMVADGTSVPVTVGLGDADARAWLRLPLVTATGAAVALADVVIVRDDPEPGELLHVDGRRAITIWAQGRPGTSASSVRAALARVLAGATIAPADLRALEAEPWSVP